MFCTHEMMHGGNTLKNLTEKEKINIDTKAQKGQSVETPKESQHEGADKEVS